MFKFFTTNTREPLRYPIKKYTKFDYIRARYRTQLDTIQNYYRNRIRGVDNSHMLARLIETCAPSLSLDVFDYFKHLDTNARNISKQFRITSNVSSGKTHRNIMLSANSSEIFLYSERNVELMTLSDTWKDLKPIKVIKTSNTALDFEIMYDRTKDTVLDVLTIFEIDIVQLLLKYYYWANEMILLDNEPNAAVFVATVVTTDILPSYFDYSMYNRFKTIASGDDMEDFDINHPFMVLDYHKGVDNIYRKIVRDVKGSSMDMEQVFKYIPVITALDVNELLKIDHAYYTKQSIWVMWACRISDIVMVMRLLGKRGIRQNSHWFNRLPVILKQIERREGTIEESLPSLLHIDFLADVEYLYEKIGKR